jgi:hypothetical protein
VRRMSVTFKALVAYAHQFQTGASSVENNLRWLTPKVGCLLSTAIEGVLVMAGDSVDLEALQTSAADNGVDVLPGAPGAGCPESRPSHYTKLVAFLQL